MKADKFWKWTVFLLVACLIAGRFAMFTNGGNGNTVWYLSFWLFCTGLFVAGALLLAEALQLRNSCTILLVVFLALVGFVSSSPIGSTSLMGLAVLLPFAVSVIVLLLLVKIVKAGKRD